MHTVRDTATAFVMHGMENHVGFQGSPQGVEGVQSMTITMSHMRDA